MISLIFAFVFPSNALTVDEAEKVLTPIKKQFLMALENGLKKGPLEALQTCQLQAPKIGKDFKVDGLVFGRTSHRLRNPANSPRDWVRPFLKQYEKTSDKSPGPSIVVNGNKGYLAPIYMKAQCLACHGQVQGKLKEKILALYPQDQATGYKLGEFRGFFWLEAQESVNKKIDFSVE